MSSAVISKLLGLGPDESYAESKISSTDPAVHRIFSGSVEESQGAEEDAEIWQIVLCPPIECTGSAVMCSGAATRCYSLRKEQTVSLGKPKEHAGT